MCSFGIGSLARLSDPQKCPPFDVDNRRLLSPKLLLPMGCVKLVKKIAFTCLLWVNKLQINCPISRFPWEVQRLCLSHLRTMLPESSTCPQPAQRPNHAT